MLSPLLIAMAVAVKLSSPGEIFFRQKRVGRDGHEFTMLKFRTMRGSPAKDGEADAGWASQIGHSGNGNGSGAFSSPNNRITGVGRLLRASSLDELPQLINVLRGDMSLVGPRPERVSYVRDFGRVVQRYNDRHRVKSGLTGWAQVNGFRGQTSIVDRVEWDNWYIQNWSLRLDLRIIAMTIAEVLRFRG
jgi:lipopolysaccharide/colanic/teichoic acid biosynthesis glycosyltransferase